MPGFKCMLVLVLVGGCSAISTDANNKKVYNLIEALQPGHLDNVKEAGEDFEKEFAQEMPEKISEKASEKGLDEGAMEVSQKESLKEEHMQENSDPEKAGLTQQGYNLMSTNSMESKKGWWTTDLWHSEERIGTKLTPQPFYQTATLGVPMDDTITLALQCDISRLDRIKHLAEQWQGPISLAVLVKKDELTSLSEKLFNYNKNIKNIVSFHVMQADRDWSFYPINAMRNFAIEQVKTEWVYILDIDENTLPMKKHMNQMKKLPKEFYSDPHTAFAVRSFEWKSERPGDAVPHSWDSLAKAFWNDKVITKHNYYPKAYAIPSMSFLEWEKTSVPERLPLKDFFEPYFIARKSFLDLFNTKFVGFRGNKVILITKMQLDNWRFYLLPKVFTFTDEGQAERNKGQRRNEDGSVQDNPIYAKELAAMIKHYPGCGTCNPEKCIENCASKKDYVIADPHTWEDATLDWDKGVSETMLN